MAVLAPLLPLRWPTTHGMMRRNMGLGLLMHASVQKLGGSADRWMNLFARTCWISAALKALNDFSSSVFALVVVVPNGGCVRSIVWGQDDGICRPLCCRRVWRTPRVIRLRGVAFPFLRRYSCTADEAYRREIGLHGRAQEMFFAE